MQQQQTNIPSQNGHSRRDHDSPEKDIVDIKDVELTLLPSYLQGEQDSNKNNAVIDNTDLLQNISKPNPQLSPPKRPPRTSQSPDGKHFYQSLTARWNCDFYARNLLWDFEFSCPKMDKMMQRLRDCGKLLSGQKLAYLKKKSKRFVYSALRASFTRFSRSRHFIDICWLRTNTKIIIFVFQALSSGLMCKSM